MAKTFDGPPTIKRSGSEHRRAVTSSLFGQERGLVRDVEPSLMVKKDGMILEIKRTLKSFSTSCFVSFSERLACSVGMRQSIPSDSSKIEIPPSASG